MVKKFRNSKFFNINTILIFNILKSIKIMFFKLCNSNLLEKSWPIPRGINPVYPEGIMLAILFGNVFAPLIDYFVVQANIRKRAARNET